jgi:hypothetical protein
MDLQGFEYPVVIDMKGAYFDKKRTPVIIDHDTNKRFGHTIEQAVIPAGATQLIGGRSMKGPMIAALAVRSSDMEIAKGITADMKKVFPSKCPLVRRSLRGSSLKKATTAEVNGKTWSGPLIVSSQNPYP